MRFMVSCLDRNFAIQTRLLFCRCIACTCSLQKLPRFLPIRVSVYAFNNEGFSYLDLNYQANCRNQIAKQIIGDDDAICIFNALFTLLFCIL